MGKFKAKQDIILRELPDVTVALCGSRVYVYPKKGRIGSIFMPRPGRYGWTERNSYRDWQRFYQKMLRYKRLTLTLCYRLAIQHDILGISNARPLNLEGKKITKRD